MKAIPTHQRAFSLMELLIVVGIMAILAVVSIPALKGTSSAAQLTSAAQRLSDELRLAQQVSTTRNMPVEVRFYLLPDPTGNASSAKIYRGYQSFLVNDDGTFTPQSKVNFLPVGITTNTASSYSTLITEFTPTAGTVAVPGVGTGYQYVAFQFRSDGSTSLASTPTGGGAWCLTLQAQRDNSGGGSGGLPANYATVQIDPLIGRVKVLRP